MASQVYRKKVAVRYSVGYVRVSTEDQATNGVSLDAQEARIGAYCTAMGWDVSEVIRDAGASAKSLLRPGVAEILRRVRRGEIERIVVAKLDRLTRSVRDLADLIELCSKHDVALVSIGETIDTGTAAGRMVVNMLGALAQWEREAIGERTADALARMRQQHVAYGTTPYGFDRSGDRLVPHPKEQRLLGTMRKLRTSGLSFNRIAEALNADGLKTRCGGAWYSATVHSILTSGMSSELASA